MNAVRKWVRWLTPGSCCWGAQSRVEEKRRSHAALQGRGQQVPGEKVRGKEAWGRNRHYELKRSGKASSMKWPRSTGGIWICRARAQGIPAKGKVCARMLIRSPTAHVPVYYNEHPLVLSIGDARWTTLLRTLKVSSCALQEGVWTVSWREYSCKGRLVLVYGAP